MDRINIHKIISGDQEAIRFWVQSYQSMAFSIAVSIVKDHQVAEEIVQDSFIKGYQGLGKYRKEAKLRTWFFRIVTNEALGYLRRQRNLPELTLMEPEIGERDFDGEVRSSDPDMEDVDLSHQHLVNEALMQLPARERLALRIFYLEEESLKTLCAITGWSATNAKVILHRARKHMFVLVSQIQKKIEP